MTSFRRAALSALLCSTVLAGAAHAQAQVSSEIARDVAESLADEIVVRGARIPDEKRATSEISSILDETSFQRTGDSDIGAALARVTGISLDQGKFVIVRGLNERYSSVTINGSPLPSPEPLQRVAPLDIIPTSILSGSLVQKTYSPEYSAEFGGGMIDLRTVTAPDEPFFEIEGSIGLDKESTFKKGLSYDGGERDWLGFDDGVRNIPAPLAATFATGNFGANQDAIDTSLNHFETLLITENDIPPDYSFKIAGGTRADLSGDISVGATVALGLSTDWRTRVGRREQGFLSSGVFGSEGQVYDFKSTGETVDANAISSVGVFLGDDHKLSFTNFILRSTVKEARISDGENGDCSCVFERTNTEFFERQVWQSQVRGDHVFSGLGDLSVNWRFAYGEAFRDSPYQRVNSYVDDGSGTLVYDFGRVSDTLANTVTFSKIEDENIDAGLDVQWPFDLLREDHTLKFGYSYTEKDRDTLNRLFQYRGSVIPELATSRIDLIYSDAVLGTNLIDLGLVGGTFFHDNTTSQLQVGAGYAGVDLALGSYLRVALGGRYEDGAQSTSSFGTLFPATSFTKTAIEEDYWLPAATITWNPTGDLQVRGGFSKTITRPQFRELSPAFFVDDDTDLLILGNPFLVNSELDNYDLRAEYYFSRGQFVTLGGFYKEISNPIEDAFRLEAGGLVISSFINAPSAKIYGLEIEFEKNFILADLVGWSFLETKDLIVKTNYTYTKSEVSADGTVTTGGLDGVTQRFVPNVVPATNFVTDGRSLQGQSNHLFNLQFGVEDVELNSRATFLVNWSSKRIRNVESFLSGVTTPVVVERPPLMVDFVYSRGFEKWGGEWEIGFEVRNILGDDYEATQDFADGATALFDSYSLGRRFSMSLKREF
jgi:outer membrane receptor protein involved in Fe transport